MKVNIGGDVDGQDVELRRSALRTPRLYQASSSNGTKAPQQQLQVCCFAGRRRAESGTVVNRSTSCYPVNKSTSPLTIEPQWLTALSDKFGTIAQELQALTTAQGAVVSEHRILRQLLEHTIPQVVAGDRSQLAALIAGFDAIKHSQSLYSPSESLSKTRQQLTPNKARCGKKFTLVAEHDELESAERGTDEALGIRFMQNATCSVQKRPYWLQSAMG